MQLIVYRMNERTIVGCFRQFTFIYFDYRQMSGGRLYEKNEISQCHHRLKLQVKNVALFQRQDRNRNKH